MTTSRTVTLILQGWFPAGRPGVPVQPFGAGHAGSVDAARLALQPHHAGRPLPAPLRGALEEILRTDLSTVRIHLGPQPEVIGAHAFTTGHDIYVTPSRFAPHSPAGRRLLGHEVAHVVQQRQGRVRVPHGRGGLMVVQDPALEREAEAVAARVAASAPGLAPPAALRGPHLHPARSGAVQPMKRKDEKDPPEKQPEKKKKKLAPVPLAVLPNQILLYIFTFLSDLDILRLFQVSQRFHELALRFFIDTNFYQQDTEPIVGRGMSKGTVISAQTHWSHAAAAFRLALSIRNRQFSKGKVPRIQLYRVSDKKSLTSAEQMGLTVPGNPSNSQQYIPGLKDQELYNFQLKGRSKSFWTVEKTGAWILGGIVARLPFVLVTDPTNDQNFKEGDVRNRNVSATVAIYAREIMQLLAAGYSIGFATKGEQPSKLEESKPVLVLRPPFRTKGRSLLEEMGATTSYMAKRTIWNRQLKDPKNLTILVNGRTITAETLSSYIQSEMLLLQLVAGLLSKVESFSERGEVIPESARRWRALDRMIQSTGGNTVQLVQILGRLSQGDRARLRQSYQEDLDLVLGYEGRVDEEIQKVVIELIKKMDG
ncbi:MAG TPA: DUF4157 domain-containing protein [Thermoanaerobaculia bacterium]|nr:DUF4157 domain-containing protein [Thermoanaerobaculia bacterium]